MALMWRCVVEWKGLGWLRMYTICGVLNHAHVCCPFFEFNLEWCTWSKVELQSERHPSVSERWAQLHMLIWCKRKKGSTLWCLLRAWHIGLWLSEKWDGLMGWNEHNNSGWDQTKTWNCTAKSWLFALRLEAVQLCLCNHGPTKCVSYSHYIRLCTFAPLRSSPEVAM